MNDKDKDAFDKWFIEKYRYNYNDLVIPESVKPQKEAWQAACEYKQKEIDDLTGQLKSCVFVYEEKVTRLLAENEKLRECVEFYANEETWFEERIIGYPIALDDEGGLARKVLKELDNNQLNNTK